MSFEGKRLQIIDENDQVQHMRVLSDSVWNQLTRLLELLSDKETEEKLKEVITTLEDTKREIVARIVKKSKTRELTKHFESALMSLPTKTLEEIATVTDPIKLEREPGGDCIHLVAGDKRHILNL